MFAAVDTNQAGRSSRGYDLLYRPDLPPLHFNHISQPVQLFLNFSKNVVVFSSFTIPLLLQSAIFAFRFSLLIRPACFSRPSWVPIALVSALSLF